MLNLYLTPRNTKAAPPTSEKEESALQLMRDHAIIGAQLGPLEYAAGDYAGRVFQLDHNSNLLPAELTFESLWVGRSQRPTFLPMDQDLHEYRDALCPVCSDPVDEQVFDEAFERLGVFPVDRVHYECPCCQTETPFANMDFGQPTAVSRFWLKLEGVAQGRLRTGFVEAVAKALGQSLLVVPEVIDDQAADWGISLRTRF